MMIDKQKLLEWLEASYLNPDISHDRARAYLRTKNAIESGRFDIKEDTQ